MYQSMTEPRKPLQEKDTQICASNSVCDVQRENFTPDVTIPRQTVSLQDAFLKYKKKKQKDMKRAKKRKDVPNEVRLRAMADPQRMWALRMKFLEQAKKYFGIPYAKKYWTSQDAEWRSRLFLDCCGLVRRVLRDLSEDFGFRVGPWNQAYLYDTLPISPDESDMQPGDLVFISAVFYNKKMKKQKHNMVHVEIWVGDGPKSIGARWHKGHVQIFDSYKFDSTSYHSMVYHFKSIDTWLMGICRSHCQEHPWKTRAEIFKPSKKSIFHLRQQVPTKPQPQPEEEKDEGASDPDEDQVENVPIVSDMKEFNLGQGDTGATPKLQDLQDLSKAGDKMVIENLTKRDIPTSDSNVKEVQLRECQTTSLDSDILCDEMPADSGRLIKDDSYFTEIEIPETAYQGVYTEFSRVNSDRLQREEETKDISPNETCVQGVTTHIENLAKYPRINSSVETASSEMAQFRNTDIENVPSINDIEITEGDILNDQQILHDSQGEGQNYTSDTDSTFDNKIRLDENASNVYPDASDAFSMKSVCVSDPSSRDNVSDENDKRDMTNYDNVKTGIFVIQSRTDDTQEQPVNIVSVVPDSDVDSSIHKPSTTGTDSNDLDSVSLLPASYPNECDLSIPNTSSVTGSNVLIDVDVRERIISNQIAIDITGESDITDFPITEEDCKNEIQLDLPNRITSDYGNDVQNLQSPSASSSSVIPNENITCDEVLVRDFKNCDINQIATELNQALPATCPDEASDGASGIDTSNQGQICHISADVPVDGDDKSTTGKSNSRSGGGTQDNRNSNSSPRRNGPKKTDDNGNKKPSQTIRTTRQRTNQLAANKQPTFFIGGANGVSLVEKPLVELGWKRVTDRYDNNVKLKWVECKSMINYNIFRPGDQLVNRIPNCSLLTNKLGLLNTLQSYERVCKTIRGRLPRMKVSDFLPETYRIDDQIDRKAFFETYKEGELWICKPTGMNQGKGIFLVRDLDNLKKTLEVRAGSHKKSHRPMDRIVQRYLSMPLLLEGRKFDIRAYMLIANTRPYLVFYHHGYVRLCLSEYRHDAHSLTAHLTNQYVQKKEANYADSKEKSVWSMEQLNDYINEHVATEKSLPKNWVENDLTNRLKEIMLYCFHAVKHKLNCSIGFFDLYGLDFMLDHNLQVWLLEINVNPSLATNCVALNLVLPDVVRETLYVSIECFEKTRRCLPLLPLKSQKKFQTLYDESSRPERPPSPRRASPTPLRSRPESPSNVQRRARSLSPAKETNQIPVQCQKLSYSQCLYKKGQQYQNSMRPYSTCGTRLPAVEQKSASATLDASLAIAQLPVVGGATVVEPAKRDIQDQQIAGGKLQIIGCPPMVEHIKCGTADVQMTRGKLQVVTGPTLGNWEPSKDKMADSFRHTLKKVTLCESRSLDKPTSPRKGTYPKGSVDTPDSDSGINPGKKPGRGS